MSIAPREPLAADVHPISGDFLNPAMVINYERSQILLRALCVICGK
jgi:hypothetical protein